MPTTYRSQLWEIAVGQYGYVTTRDAHALGIPVVELGKLAARRRLTKVGHGVYRFDELPADSRGQFLEATLRVGFNAYLINDAVLALHNLAFVNPRKITVGTPKRNRAQVPNWINVVRDVTPPHELTNYEGIPSTTVATALRMCMKTVMQERLLEATRDAEQRGLVTPSEAAHLFEDFNR